MYSLISWFRMVNGNISCEVSRISNGKREVLTLTAEEAKSRFGIQ